MELGISGKEGGLASKTEFSFFFKEVKQRAEIISMPVLRRISVDRIS